MISQNTLPTPKRQMEFDIARGVAIFFDDLTTYLVITF